MEASLIRSQTSFPIFRGVIGLASMKVIAMVTYLGSQRFVAPIIASKFCKTAAHFYLGL
jgi:hypothetical protein